MSGPPETGLLAQRVPDGVGAAEVLTIASDVWRVLAGTAALPAVDAGAVHRPPADVEGLDVGGCDVGGLRAWVTFDGPWRGLVQLACSTETAAAMTAAVVGGTVPAHASAPATPADVTDVLGELVNVVGGGVKSRVPGSTQLGLPVVVEGPEPPTPGHEVLHVDLTWTQRPFRVCLHHLPPHL